MIHIELFSYSPEGKRDPDVICPAQKVFKFPAGELGVDIKKPDNIKHSVTQINIYAEIVTAEEIFELIFTNQILRRQYPNTIIKLSIPYIPYGRQDRFTTTETSFSLKIIADLINYCKFDEVKTITPHSNVTELLINNLVVQEFWDTGYKNLFREFFVDDQNPIFIAPDNGAEKRVYAAAKEYGVNEVVVCSKKRNPANGQIIGYAIPPIPENRNLVVIDDICDGGGTFIELAKHLPKYNSLSLVVTHGIFSKGKKPLEDAGYKIFTLYDFIARKNGYITT